MKSGLRWQRAAEGFLTIDRFVLAAYTAALVGLLLFPLAGPNFSLLGIESDKWMHFVLFGGLAILFRWNLSAGRRPVISSIAAGFVAAVATEVGQGVIAYRSAETLDLVAGTLGTLLGATIGDRIFVSAFVQRLLGLLVTILGFMVSALFALADLIGVGDGRQFGLLQITGIALGAIVVIGGVRVYLIGMRSRV